MEGQAQVPEVEAGHGQVYSDLRRMQRSAILIFQGHLYREVTGGKTVPREGSDTAEGSVQVQWGLMPCNEAVRETGRECGE